MQSEWEIGRIGEENKWEGVGEKILHGSRENPMNIIDLIIDQYFYPLFVMVNALQQLE